MFSVLTRGQYLTFIGDLTSLVVALWGALFLRHVSLPSWESFTVHVTYFIPLFFVSFLVFVIVGLYDKRVVLFEKQLSALVIEAQVVNVVIAVLFFFFLPNTPIAPKTTLLIYLGVSVFFIVVWRLFILKALLRYKKNPQKMLVIGAGKSLNELLREIEINSHLNITPHTIIDLEKPDHVCSAQETLHKINASDISIAVILYGHPKLKQVSHSTLSKITENPQVSSMHFNSFYEYVFERIPLHAHYLLGDGQFFVTQNSVYMFAKRVIDIFGACIAGTLSVPVYPIVFLLILLEDGRPLFVSQQRVGKDGSLITIWKFRTMNGSDQGTDVLKSTLKVTKVGHFLRKTRIDELPQLWSVLKGDQSLVGPRPELPALVEQYMSQIPLYNARHSVKPGLSGWAQINHQQHPHHGVDLEETERKLSYDLFYVKNRSFLLDLEIGLRTIKTLILRVGR